MERRARSGELTISVQSMMALLLLFCTPVLEARSDPLSWPDEDAQFWFNGGNLLLSDEDERRLKSATAGERTAWIANFLETDPIAVTDQNELTLGIAARRALVLSEHQSYLDDRAKLLFLHGRPSAVTKVDCSEVYRPLEIWSYPGFRPLLLYRTEESRNFRLWLPLETKRALYTAEMESFLEQLRELSRRPRKFDRNLCDQARLVDEVTGIVGLSTPMEGKPTNQELLSSLAPPADLGEWARVAAGTRLPEQPDGLTVLRQVADFPERRGQRTEARVVLVLDKSGFVAAGQEADETPHFQVKVDGIVEHDNEVFEDFKLRYRLRADGGEPGLVVALERAYRGDRAYLMRLRVSDEVGGSFRHLTIPLDVPLEPRVEWDELVAGSVEPDEEATEAVTRATGEQTLLLFPPDRDVVFGLWRAEVLTRGEKIESVLFLVDGSVQVRRSRPPFTAELRLSEQPMEQWIRVEGLDANGEMVASDELVLNQQSGQLSVNVLEPSAPVSGQLVDVVAQVVVPEEREVEQVTFKLNEEVIATKQRPPWRQQVEVPDAVEGAVTYVTVQAELDDGSLAEDTQFLQAPPGMEEVNVDLVELYVSVADRNRQLIRGLDPSELEVLEDGARQEISRFELVENLPITVGVSIDTSGSMTESLGEARRAALDFLRSIVTHRDRAFALAFANHVDLLMSRTSDVDAISMAMEDLRAVGSTSLYDAAITSLYYFRGQRGRRALVMLSDGEDTASVTEYKEVLEYARRSGVVIYTVGLRIPVLAIDHRRKLSQLAEETGGQAFFIDGASELAGAYGQIEQDLRSQYLVSYAPRRPLDGGPFREVEVKVRRSGAKARTIRGYYP